MCIRDRYSPAAGLVRVTSSSEPPLVEEPTGLPSLRTVRSRSALGSAAAPIAASKRVTPSPRVTVVVRVSPCLIVGRSVFEEPRRPPLSVPSSAAKPLVAFQATAAGVPTLASATVWTAGSKVVPSTVAVSV